MHDAVLAIGRKYGIQRALDKTLLQLLGTEWGRKTVDPNVWVNVLQAKVRAIRNLDPNAKIVIDDCRFPNELEAFPDFLKIRLECDRQLRKMRCSQWRENESHISESALTGVGFLFDHVLNTGVTDSNSLYELVKQYANIKHY